MLLHAASSAKGSAVAAASRGSTVSNTVELTRGLAACGSYLAKKRFEEVGKAREKIGAATRKVLGGVHGAGGGLRTEATYLCASQGTDWAIYGAVEVMAADVLCEVYGIQDDGWNDEDSTFALPTRVVERLLRALYVRGLATIEFGLELATSTSNDPDGRVGLDEQLPLGHLPVLAERTLAAEALSLQLPGLVGSELRAGLGYHGFLGDERCRTLSCLGVVHLLFLR